MKRPTYKQLESDLRQCQADSGILHCLLNDILNERVTWFRRGKTRIGVSRENGAEGGLVIHRQMDGSSPYACAYHWEKWFPAIRDNCPAHTDSAAQDLRNCAFEAHEHIMKIQNQEVA